MKFILSLLLITTSIFCSEEWLQASLQERIVIAQRIGESGAEKYAESRNLKCLLSTKDRKIRQGLDLIYEDGDKVIVIEAKGGKSELKRTYGSVQGTIENVISSAEYVIKSKKANDLERKAALRVLEGARTKKLEVWVVRTGHVLGDALQAECKQITVCSETLKKE